MTPFVLALRRLGYRQPHREKPLWIKPMGYSVLMVDTESAKIYSRFMGANGKVQTWNHAAIETTEEGIGQSGTIEEQLSHFENYHFFLIKRVSDLFLP